MLICVIRPGEKEKRVSGIFSVKAAGCLPDVCCFAWQARLDEVGEKACLQA